MSYEAVKQTNDESLEEVMERLCLYLEIPITYDVQKIAYEAVKKGATTVWTLEFYAKMADLYQTML